MAVLVTGGAGYIGAHVVRLLQEKGHDVVVVDDLVSGTASRIQPIYPVVMNLAEESATARLTTLLLEHKVESVIHFAARKQVGESVQRPAWYFNENVGGLANLLLAMETAGTDRLVFSSSAAVYGEASGEEISESSPLSPVSPYGETKLIGEWLVSDAVVSQGIKAISLRYFNVAGAAHPELGDPAVLNLVPMVFERIDANAAPRIFGNDYQTPDGTCIRDYIHVLDLASAHIDALEALHKQKSPGHRAFNVGTGVGTSVSEMVNLILDISGATHEPQILPRRPGDPASVVADPTKIRNELGWVSTHSTRDIVESAWAAHLFQRNNCTV